MAQTRSKNKIQNILTLKHAYVYYSKDMDKESKYWVDSKTYRNICEDFNKMVMEGIIKDGDFFVMPYRLGTLRIKKRRVDLNNLKPDFSTYNEKHIKNKHLNEHSGGYYVRFYWNKLMATIVRNKTAYSFIPTRFNKRFLAQTVKDRGRSQINKYFD